MKSVLKKNLNFRMRRLTIGCGIQGSDCLALAVQGRPGAWRLRWSLLGDPDDAAFIDALSKRVWRRPLWAPPFDQGVEVDTVVEGIDLSFLPGRGGGDGASGARRGRASGARATAAFRTQLLGRFTQAAEEPLLCGVDLHAGSGGGHLTGAVASRQAIRRCYEQWHRKRKIIHPHIAPHAAAVANLYLSLYPEAERKRDPFRIVVLDARDFIYAVLIDDWKLLDFAQWQMTDGQVLNPAMVQGWIQYFDEYHTLPDHLSVCVIDTQQTVDEPDRFEIWNPFADLAGWAVERGVREHLREHPDLAALAFGMALQGN